MRQLVRNNHFVFNSALSGISALPLLLFTASLIAAHKSSEETSVAQDQDHNKHFTAVTSDMEPGAQLTHDTYSDFD